MTITGFRSASFLYLNTFRHPHRCPPEAASLVGTSKRERAGSAAAASSRIRRRRYVELGVSLGLCSTCLISHLWVQVNVCKYFQLGHCRYGDKCMYDHVRPAAGRHCDPTQAAGTTCGVLAVKSCLCTSTRKNLALVSRRSQQQAPAAARVKTLISTKLGFDSNAEVKPEQPAWQPLEEDAWASPQRGSHMQSDDGEQPESSPLCQRLQAYGNCPNGDACSAAHGLLCEVQYA